MTHGQLTVAGDPERGWFQLLECWPGQAADGTCASKLLGRYHTWAELVAAIDFFNAQHAAEPTP